MRLGTSVHPDGKPVWSPRFQLESGNHVRRVSVQPSDRRPEWYVCVIPLQCSVLLGYCKILLLHSDSLRSLCVCRVYNIGIETSKGTGSHSLTNMVTLVPYNVIINRCSQRIAFTQKHLTTITDSVSCSRNCLYHYYKDNIP